MAIPPRGAHSLAFAMRCRPLAGPIAQRAQHQSRRSACPLKYAGLARSRTRCGEAVWIAYARSFALRIQMSSLYDMPQACVKGAEVDSCLSLQHVAYSVRLSSTGYQTHIHLWTAQRGSKLAQGKDT